MYPKLTEAQHSTAIALLDSYEHVDAIKAILTTKPTELNAEWNIATVDDVEYSILIEDTTAYLTAYTKDGLETRTLIQF